MDRMTENDSSLQQAKNLLPIVHSIPNDGIKHHELLNPSQSVGMRSGLVTLRSGQNVGSHSTGKNEELLLILSGIGEVELGGTGRRRIQGGCIAYIPPDTQHNVFNISDEPLRYVYVVSHCE